MRRRPGVLEKLILLCSPVILLVLWELLSRAGALDVRFFSRPSLVVSYILSPDVAGQLVSNTAISLRRVGAGFVLGAVPATILGLLMGFSGAVRGFFAPILAATYPIPKISLLPLMLLIFGIGETSKAILVAIGVFFPMVYSVANGVRNQPVSYQQVASVSGASRTQYLRMVALPGALPDIFTGLKLSLGIALLLIVAAEFTGTTAGIGFMIWNSWQIFNVEQMYTGLIILSLLGFGFSTMLDVLEDRLLPWRDRA